MAATPDPYDLERFVARIREYGWSNGLSAKLLQLTGPGLPDVYQGSELWEHSLVDPYNRRAVDFAHRARVLADLVLLGPGSDDDRLRTAFIRLAGRQPDTQELKILQRTLDEQRTLFRKDLLGATRLINFGASKATPTLRPSELAAMTVTVQTILNSDAVIWKR